MKRIVLLSVFPLFLLAGQAMAATWVKVFYGKGDILYPELYITKYLDIRSITELNGTRYVNQKVIRVFQDGSVHSKFILPAATEVSCSQGIIKEGSSGLAYKLVNGNEWWTPYSIKKGARNNNKTILKIHGTTQDKMNKKEDDENNGIFEVVCGTRPTKDKQKLPGVMS